MRKPRQVRYRWKLRELMAAQGLWKSTELSPLLAQRGIALSDSQVYRLVVGQPERLSLVTLAALCDILGCTPSELIETSAGAAPIKAKAASGRPAAVRPRRARVAKKA
ncbi:MAG: helix-turn-helix domain-containing protein [Acidimicrobiales bacterium]